MLERRAEEPNASINSKSGSKRVILCAASIFYSQSWIYSIHNWSDVRWTLPDELSGEKRCFFI
jgi:hypothetical protein